MDNTSTYFPELNFDAVYRGEGPFVAPWDIGAPQPAFIEVERSDGLDGHILDAGCGTGENALYLSGCGYEVTGLDSAPTAIESARHKAADRRLGAIFEIADILALDAYAGRFDVVVDSALAHIFDGPTLRRYAAALHRATRPGARVYLLAVSEDGSREMHSRFGAAMSQVGRDEAEVESLRAAIPRKRADELTEGFADGWQTVSMEKSAMATVLPPDDGAVHIDAWLGCFRRA
ncbi:class I SAM-dependent methyltransferase [Nocardia sp. alder85J]|uniref:class I SAM-dependent methyltransferase n=1 Tax=Nocardia sp. alder85J TaxID=2862949 RepID=UPI001CD2AD9F|nr:class I SAM-dependent methyltransferase [Nocardia sp. alder85J]MCX4095771.1 class I SAM-dependent methyltransferase [Nocardia sp. alder85J]